LIGQDPVSGHVVAFAAGAAIWSKLLGRDGEGDVPVRQAVGERPSR